MTYPLSTLSLLLFSSLFVLFPSLLFLLASDFLLSLALFFFLFSSSSLLLFLSFLLGLSCPALASCFLWVYLWFLGSGFWGFWGFLNTPQNITIYTDYYNSSLPVTVHHKLLQFITDCLQFITNCYNLSRHHLKMILITVQVEFKCRYNHSSAYFFFT